VYILGPRTNPIYGVSNMAAKAKKAKKKVAKKKAAKKK
jgi:hypothetical protein